jgi:hypothetical protein
VKLLGKAPFALENAPAAPIAAPLELLLFVAIAVLLDPLTENVCAETVVAHATTATAAAKAKNDFCNIVLNPYKLTLGTVLSQHRKKANWHHQPTPDLGQAEIVQHVISLHSSDRV